MFNLFTKKKVKPMHVMPGDTIRIRYQSPQRDANGKPIPKTVREEVLDHLITEEAIYDTLAVGEIEDELGFKNGLVGIVGNE